MSVHQAQPRRKTILITGASSGIGAALAHASAKRGMNLALVARRLGELEVLAETLRDEYGIQVEVAELDVREDSKIMPIFLGLSELLGQIDIVVANAGILRNREPGDGHLERDAQIFKTNVMGAIATSEGAISLFRVQRSAGQIVAISSYSAFFPLMGAAAYSASKAAVGNYFNAIRPVLAREDIKVSVIYPGFVQTDMLRGFKAPLVAKPADVAEEILNAILAGKRNAIVPRLPWSIFHQIQRLIPSAVIDNLQKHM